MLTYWYDLATFAVECQQVMFLRAVRLAAGGPGAGRESRRMISEKVAAAAHATQRLSQGATPGSVIADYRKRVRANVRRLAKAKR